MPKITSYKYRGYDVKISYHLKNNKFSILLPEEMSSYSYNGEIHDDKIDNLEREFNKIVDNFIIEKAERVKFIVIEIKDFYDCNDEFYRANGFSGYLHLQYAVVDKVKINGEYQYKYKPTINSREQHFYIKDKILIEWTEQREQYLKQTIDGIKNLSSNVKKFMESDNILSLIDSKTPSLMIENK
jgi:hypothetical protein